MSHICIYKEFISFIKLMFRHKENCMDCLSVYFNNISAVAHFSHEDISQNL